MRLYSLEAEIGGAFDDIDKDGIRFNIQSKSLNGEPERVSHMN